MNERARAQRLVPGRKSKWYVVRNRGWCDGDKTVSDQGRLPIAIELPVAISTPTEQAVNNNQQGGDNGRY